MTQPKYPGSSQFTASSLIQLLRQATSHPAHQFWPDEVTLRDPRMFHPGGLRGPAHITDAYLLGLAVHCGGKLVTLDREMRLAAVPAAASAHLELI